MRAPDAPILYLASGRLEDRKGYVAAIRAFALGAKLGDRLTVTGYGRHRPCLERWVEALGIEAVVAFAEPTFVAATHLPLFDALVVMSYEQQATFPLMQIALSRGLGVIAAGASMKRGVVRLGRGVLVRVEPRDVLSYARAMALLSHGF